MKSRSYLLQEGVLILAWAYLIVVGGGITGQINFRVQLANAVLGALVFGGWLILRLGMRRAIPRSGLELGILLFLGAVVLATVFSHDVRRSLGSLALYATYALAFYLWLDLGRSGVPAELIEKTLLIVGGIVIGFGLADTARSFLAWRALVAGGQLPFAPPYVYRLYSLLGDANLAAALVNLMIPLAVMRGAAAWIREKGNRERERADQVRFLPSASSVTLFGWWAYAASGLVFVFFTSSRGGWLGTAAALSVLAMFQVLTRTRDVISRLGSRRSLLVPVAFFRLFRRRPAISIAIAIAVAVLVVGGGTLVVRQGIGPTHGPLLESRTVFWRAAWLAFTSSPITGAGLGTYPTVFTRYAGVPPERPYLHAHSVPITLLAETGLIGVLGLAFLLITLGRLLIHRARTAVLNPLARSPLSGILASLAGLAVHSLFDNDIVFPAIGVSAVCLVALACLPEQSRPDGPAQPPRAGLLGLSPGLLMLVGIPIAGFAAYSLSAYAVSERGVQASASGDWGAGARYFDEAARRDPYFALYRLNSGFAYGMLAARGEKGALAAAIERYESGLRLEPDYSVNYANLAALYFQAGRAAKARAAMEMAIDLAAPPGSSLYWLNLGLFMESLGGAGASPAYVRAIEAKPAIAESAFWHGSQERRDVVAEWSKDAPQTTGDLALGFNRLAARDVGGAQAAFESAWRADPLGGAVYFGFAQVALAADGDDAGQPLAEGYLAAALSLQTTENESKVQPLLTWAELSARRGQVERARGQYEAAYQAVTGATAYGWGMQGFSPYAWFVFNRNSLPADLLPQLVRADVSPALAARFVPLGAMRESAGDTAGAIAVYRQVMMFDPESYAARQHLAALGAR